MMTFSRYGEYVAALAARDNLVWLAFFATLSVLVFLLGLRLWPRVQRVAAWLWIGVFYALMGFVYLSWGVSP